MPFPLAPARPESHGTRGHARLTFLTLLTLTSLDDQHPRSGWGRPRTVETSDTFYFILYPKKKYR
jgi:hypothetical protein